MASEDTLLGSDFRLQIGDGNSPEVFLDFCDASEVAGLGEAKPQVDVTSLCDLARTFRGGLAEGSEVTISANMIQGAAQTRALFESYGADEVVNWRLVMFGISPEEYFAWSSTILGWSLANVTPGEKQSIQFTAKTSGPVEWIYT